MQRDSHRSYCAQREFPDTTQEVDDRTVNMSSSYRSYGGRAYTPTLAPMPGVPYVNPPMYRSFDQGSLMSYSSRYVRDVRACVCVIHTCMAFDQGSLMSFSSRYVHDVRACVCVCVTHTCIALIRAP